MNVVKNYYEVLWMKGIYCTFPNNYTYNYTLHDIIISYQPLHAWMLLQIEVETGKQYPKKDNSDNAFYISSKMSTSVIKMSGRACSDIFK